MSPEHKRLYARQLLVTEIGAAGQERLCATTVCVLRGSDAAATRVACDYLARAGVRLADETAAGAMQASPLRIDGGEVDRLAGDPLLREAAAWLAGAWAALETIKQVTGAGAPSALPADFVLAETGS